MNEILSKIAEVDYYVRWHSSQHDLGIWSSRQIGGTADFEAIAEYQFGDNPRSINWSATARTGFHRILKNTRLTEANLAVFLLVDLSPSMDFGTVRVTKRRLAAELSGVLTHAAWRCGDRVAFVGYGSDVEVEWPLRNPKDYRLLIPQKILETSVNGNGQAGLSPALLRLPAKRALVFLLSDFQDDLGEIEEALKPVTRRHDVVSIILWDPRELNEDVLREISQGTGGKYLHLTSAKKLKGVLRDPGVIGARALSGGSEMFQIPLGLAMGILFLGIYLERRTISNRPFARPHV